MTMSRILMWPRFGFFGVASSIFTTLSLWRRSCAMTSSRDCASSVAVRISPANDLAVYVKVAILIDPLLLVASAMPTLTADR
jgi:hypothetical protein